MKACARSRCSSATWSMPSGESLEQNAIRTRRALDPRVTYLVTSMLEDVINHGTGATVRARGFTAPAAGKTGTSRDGWFAGYTSNLLAIVWVGFDDNRDLGLSGANAPAPIWAEFMKRAITLPAYRDVQPFEMPEGVTRVTIDPETLHARHSRMSGHARGSLHPRHGAHRVLPLARRAHGERCASRFLAIACFWRRQGQGNRFRESGRVRTHKRAASLAAGLRR